MFIFTKLFVKTFNILSQIIDRTVARVCTSSIDSICLQRESHSVCGISLLFPVPVMSYSNALSHTDPILMTVPVMSYSNTFACSILTTLSVEA